MSDHPILFSGPMIRALLDGRKTQTRRVLPNSANVKCVTKMGPGVWQFSSQVHGDEPGPGPRAPRVVEGDRLWVREAWCVSERWDSIAPRDIIPREVTVVFDAGGSIANQDERGDWRPSDWPDTGITLNWIGKLRPSIFLPRWASRLTLLVSEVRVQRLQDISEDDAAAEGWPAPEARAKEGIAEIRDAYPIGWFAHLWDSINAARGFGWDTNPWVVATSFRVEKINIDQMPGRIVHKHLNIRGSEND